VTQSTQVKISIFTDSGYVRVESKRVIEGDAKGCNFIGKFDCGTGNVDVRNGVKRLKTLTRAKQDCIRFGWV
jgi:hypothetical protein